MGFLPGARILSAAPGGRMPFGAGGRPSFRPAAAVDSAGPSALDAGSGAFAAAASADGPGAGTMDPTGAALAEGGRFVAIELDDGLPAAGTSVRAACGLRPGSGEVLLPPSQPRSRPLSSAGRAMRRTPHP